MYTAPVYSTTTCATATFSVSGRVEARKASISLEAETAVGSDATNAPELCLENV